LTDPAEARPDPVALYHPDAIRWEHRGVPCGIGPSPSRLPFWCGYVNTGGLEIDEDRAAILVPGGVRWGHWHWIGFDTNTVGGAWTREAFRVQLEQIADLVVAARERAEAARYGWKFEPGQSCAILVDRTPDGFNALITVDHTGRKPKVNWTDRRGKPCDRKVASVSEAVAALALRGYSPPQPLILALQAWQRSEP
jgi:hypothetical protein